MRGRRTTSILAVLGLAALAAGSLAGAPAAARSPLDRVELGAVNVLHTDRMAGVSVHIPRDATVEADFFSNDDVSYEGRGRIVGLALVEEGEPARRAFQFVSVRWSFCGTRACKPDRYADEITSISRWRGKRWTIPAGDYRLYVVADGAPVEVTLRLHGLTGHTSLHPSEAVAGRVAAPKAVGAALATDHLFLGRARPVHMPVPGLLIDGESHDFGLGPAVGAQGSCFWRGKRDQDVERTVPGPHCMRFAERYGWGGGFTTLGGGGASWGLGTVPAGTWRSSYWGANAAALPEGEFLTLWLAYEDLAG